MSRLRFYMKFAFSNLRKNKQLYLPQMITSIGLVAVFYIVYTISIDEKLRSGRGGDVLPGIMEIGVNVLAILSVILLLYTNSFLMKQRKKELGLFHVLGLEKRHVNGIMLMETMITFVVSAVGGILVGVLLYKLCILCICHLLKLELVLGFYASGTSIVRSVLLFLVIYFGICVVNSISVARMKPIEMMKSDKVGEKEPKIKWITLIIGVLALGGGYGISLSVESPLKAIFLFFLAVVLVIIGTYCIFIAGSIGILKMLKKKKSFYYHPTHMTAVSGLLYRMKQNAVGLASICILSTAVIVMISTTVNMYVGIEDSTNKRCPADISVANVHMDGYTVEEVDEMLDQIVKEQAEKYQVEVEKSYTQDYFMAAYHDDDGKNFSTDLKEGFTSNVVMCCFMTAKQYEALTGEKVELSGNQVACYEEKNNTKSYSGTLSIAGDTVEIKTKLKQYPVEMSAYTLYNCLEFVVADDAMLQKIYDTQEKSYGNNASAMEHQYMCDLKGSVDKKRKVEDAVEKEIVKRLSDKEVVHINYEAKEQTKENYYNLNGSLLVLGIMLGVVFLFVTMLIIYYKQISEGYEDRNRFQIMQKVGMTKKEVQKSIYSQIKLVFFSPLVLALAHTIVAFPILLKLLRTLFTTETSLFFFGILFTYIVFGLVYFAIYWLTAKVYYKIVRL